jgi:hypothetical protein
MAAASVTKLSSHHQLARLPDKTCCCQGEMQLQNLPLATPCLAGTSTPARAAGPEWPPPVLLLLVLLLLPLLLLLLLLRCCPACLQQV